MYLGRSANPLLLRHGLNGPISTEHLRSRTSSVNSQGTRRGPLRADHNLQTPRSANDREIEEINRQAEAVERARQRNPKPRPQRPLSAQLHPTYFTDLADDTNPTSPRDRSGDADVPRPHSARRRVYLIKRPQSAPVYGRITPVSCRSEGPSSGRGSTDLREKDTVAADDSRVRVVSEGHFNPSTAAEGPLSHSNRELLRNSGGTSERGLGSPLSTQRSDVDVNSARESFQTVPLTSHGNSTDGAPEDVHDSRVTGSRNSFAEPGAKGDLETERSGNSSPVRFIENEKERKLHREGSFHVTHVPVKRVRDTGVHSDHQNKDTNSDSHSSPSERQTRLPEHLLQSGDTRPPPISTLSNIIQQHARDTQHEETLHLLDSSPSDREAVLLNLAKALRLQSEAVSAHSSAEDDSDFDDEDRLHLSEHTQQTLYSTYTPRAEGPNSFSELNTAGDCSVSRREKREALSASAETLVHERPPDSKTVSSHQATNDSSSSVAKEKRSKALASVSDSNLASSRSQSRPQTQRNDYRATNATELSTHSHSPRNPQSARSTQRQIPTASSTLTSESPRESSSSLQASRGAFGSVDSLLVGLDAETKASVKKNKNKRSLFKNWFTPKRGKYNPGEESIPVIESAPLDRVDSTISDTKNVHELEANKYNTVRIRKSSAPPSFNRSDEFSDRSAGPAVKKKEEQTFVTPESPAADVMDGSLTARSQKSEPSKQNTALSEVVASSRSDSVTSATVRAVSHSSKQTLTSISKQKTMEVSESQTTSSSVLKTESSLASKTESSDGSLSLLSAQLLGRGNASAGAYENTRVASKSHVTRREMITIQGSALNSYDKSIMLNDSGFPEELGSTFKAKPVMVRERKVSPLSPHGSQESQDLLSSFGRQGSNSSSSLSLVEIDPSGAMRLSPKYGSREDQDLFSKASKIVHAQRSEDTQENDVSNDDDHELVVIREYVFAARKHGPGDSTPTTPRVEITSSETNTISATTVQSSVHSTLETRNQESSTKLHSSFRSSRKANDEEEELSQVSSTSALKEDDSGLDSPPSMQDALPLPPTKPKRTGRASREIDVTEVSHLRSKSSEEMPASDDTLLTKKQQQSVLIPGAKPGSKGDSHADDSTGSGKSQSPGGLEKYGVTVNDNSSPLDAAVAAAGSRPTQEKEQRADVGDKTKSMDSQKDTKQDLTSTGSKLSDNTSNKVNLDQEEIIVADAVKSSLFHAAASADKSTKDEEHLITVKSDSKPVHAVTVKSKEADNQTENSPGHSGPEAFVNRLFEHQQAVKHKVKTAETTPLGSADGKPGQDTAESSVPDNMSKQTAGPVPAGNFNPAPQREEKDQPEDAISKEFSLTPSSVTDIYASPQKKQKEKGNEVSSSPAILRAQSTKDIPDETSKDVPAQDDKKADVSVTEVAAAAVSALYAVPQKKPKESTQPDSTSAESDSQSSLGPIYAQPDKKRKGGVQQGTHQDFSKDDVSLSSEKDAVVESGISDKKPASAFHLSTDLTKTSHLDANVDVQANENIPEDKIKMSSAATVIAQKQPPKHYTGQDDKGDEPQGKAADKDSEGNNDTTQEITGAALEAGQKFQDAGTTDEKNELHAANSAENSKSQSRLNRQRDSLTEEEYHKPWSSDFSSLEDDIRNRIASAFPSAEEGQENEYEQALTADKPASESAVKATAASPNHYAMKELNRLAQGDTISDNMNLPDETSHPTADPAKNPDAADSQSSSKAGTDAMNVYSEVHCGPEGEKATENIAALVSAVPTISTTPTTARKISGNRLDRPPLPRTPSPSATRNISDNSLDKPALPLTPSPSGTRKISDTRLDRPPLPRTPSPSATRKISDTSSNRSPVLMSRSPAALRKISDKGLDRPPLPLTPAPPASRKVSDNRLDKPALPMAPSPSATRKMSDDQSNRSPVLMSRSPVAPKKMSDNRADRPTLPMPPLPPVANKSQKDESPVKLAGAKDEEAKTSQNEKVQDKKEEEEAKPGPEVKADGAKPTKEKPSKSGSEEKASPHHHNKLKEKFKKVFSHSSEDKKAAKAENKKGSPSTQKKEMKGAAPEEDKPTKLGEKKKDKKTPTPEEKKLSPAIEIKDRSEAINESNTSQTEPVTQSKNPATEDEVRNKDPNKAKDESSEEKSGRDKGDDKESDVQQSQPLSVQEYQDNVKLPLPPTEAKKLIKAEKKNAAKTQREEAKSAVSKEDQKISSPKAPNKAFKWFKKKLGNKEKKAPKTKKYNINAAGEEDEAEHEGEGDTEEKPTGRGAPNSDSEDTHDSSNSSSESDNESNEGEKKKTKKKIPFWKGKKDKKKKAAENESDSDTSAEESKSKLFSWSLGRKKDTSDHEDNLPAGSKKNADWTQGEDASGVSGTFRKISDNITHSQPPPTNESTKKNSKEGLTSKEQDALKEASLSKSNAGPPLKSKPKPERTTKSKPEADSKDQEAQPTHQTPNNAVKESGAEKGEDAIKNSKPDASVLSSEKPSSNARPKLFVIGDSEDLKGKARDIGEYTMLRQDATLTQKDAARSPKLPKNSGYELARPLFLEDDGDKANCVLSSKEKVPEDATAMSGQVDKLESLVKAEATNLKKINGELQHEATEDIIIPVKADRPVHQALKLLEKSSNEDPRTEKSDIPDKSVGDAKSSLSKANPGQMGIYPPSPVLGPKMNTPPVSVKPRPKVRREEAVRDPAVEEEIIPSKAEEECRGQRLSTNMAFKSKTPKPDTRDDTNNKVTNDPKNVDVDTHTLTGAKDKVHGAASEITNPSSSDVDTPRSNTDSIGSPGRTYIDSSDFLDTAKASWGLQENKTTDSEHEKSPKSSPSMTNANRKNAAGFASLLNESKKVKAEFKEAGKTNSEEHPLDANSCNPSELACSFESKSVVDDKINPETTATVQSPPDPSFVKSTNASSSSPRGLDSQDSKPADKNVDPPKTSPTKPAISAKKPDVRPKVFAKPKLFRPRGEKGDTDDQEKKPEPLTAENISKAEKSASTQSASPSTKINSSIKPGEEMSAKNETISINVDPETKSTVAASTAESPRRGDGSGDKATVRGKPLPPERSKTADKTDADDESTELQNPTISSPAPKPRTSVKGLKDSPAGVFLKNTIPANTETEKQERPTVSLQKQERDSGSNEGVESPQHSALQETASLLSSALSEDSLDTRSAMSHPSTSTWAETDTQSTLGPDAGDFTLSLEPDAKLSGKQKTGRETETGQSAGDFTLSFDTDTKLSDKVKAEDEAVADPSAENVTLSLDTDTGSSEKKDIPPYATARIKKHSVSSIERSMELEDETEHKERKDSSSTAKTSAVNSDLTLVTPLSEFNKGKKPAPIFRSTPVAGSTNVSTDVTMLRSSMEEEITVTSVSTISESTTSVRSETVMLMTDTANEQYDSEIYEPIFFDDDTDPKSSKKKRTEAPPVRPEKLRKRQRNLTEIIQPDFKDDDADSMYDVPPSRRQFAFPKETSLPVFSVVENPKRNSRGSPRVTRAFEPEPEDSIAPYATYHRPQSLLLEPDPDYLDDENPYMNDDEDDLNNLTGIKSTSTEKRASFDDSAEPIHVSLSELNLKELSKSEHESVAESISSSEITPSSKSPEKAEVQDAAGETSEITVEKSDMPKHKLVHLDSVSSDSSSGTESASSSHTEDGKSPKLEAKKTTEKLEQSSPVTVASSEKKITEKLEQSSPVSVASSEKKTTEKLEQSSPVSVASSEKKTTTEADDQFLTSAEYATSVEEINKLYAALEKEEEEMERRSSSREQSASPNKSPGTKEPVGRLLSFEEQRACLMPLKTKTEDEPEPEPQSEETQAEPSKTVSKKKTKKEIKAATKKEKTSNSFNETRKTTTETSVVKVQTTKSFNVFRKTSSQDCSQSEKEEEAEEKAPDTKVYQSGFFSRFKKSPSNDPNKTAQKTDKKDTYPKQSDHDDKIKKKESSTLHETEDKTKSPVTLETVLSVTATEKKGEASPPKANDVLPPITSYSKLVDTVVHMGEEKQVKIKPEEDSKGQEEAGAERKTSFEDDDFSKFQLDFMETSLENEVLGHATYAKVRKESTTSSIHSQPDAGSAEPAPKRKDSSQKDVENLQVDEKISKVSSFLVSTEASPPMQEAKKVESAEHIKSPTDELAGTDPGKISEDVVQEKKAPKTSTAPRAKPPPPPRKDLALKNTPSTETSEKTIESESDKTASVVPEEKDDLNSITEPSVAVFAPKAAARKSSLVPPADTDYSKAPAEKPKPSAKPSLKPRPRPKPRDSVILAAEQITPTEVTVVNKTPSQSDPDDLNLAVTSASGKPDSTQDSIAGEVSDKNKISEQPATSSAQRMAQKVGIRLPAPPNKDSRPEKDSSLILPSKTASLPAGSSLQDATDSKGDRKKKKKRPLSGDAAAAMAESDDEDDDDYDSEDEETDDDDDEDDDERKAVGVDGESPPLPERQYKKKKTKYNEYSNVIRVDSGRLKDARIRSLSRPSLADSSQDKPEKNSRLRNAVSMEGGLDAHHKKQKVKKNKKNKEASGEDGDKKAKKHFGFNPFKGLFGHKKQKKKDGEEGEKEKDEGDNEDNVYELVDDYPEPKHKKGTTDTKTTPPKPAKKPKAKDHAPPPSHPPIKAVDSSHVPLDIRPIGRLLQLNPDGTQLLELIRPANGNLGVQLTQGNEETLQGKFVSGFVDKSTEKLLSGILNIGDQILKINDRSIDNCPLIEVHDIIDTQQRLKFLVFPAQ